MWKAELSIDSRLIGLLRGLCIIDSSSQKHSAQLNVLVAINVTQDGVKLSTCHPSISACAHLFLPRSCFHSFECSQDVETLCVSLSVLLDLVAEASRGGLVFRFDWSPQVDDYLAVEWRGTDGARINCKLCLFEQFPILANVNLADQSADAMRIIMTADQWKAMFVYGDMRMSDRMTIQASDSMIKLSFVSHSGTELMCTHSKTDSIPWQSLSCHGLFEASYRTICFTVITQAASISEKVVMRCRQVDALCEVDILCPLTSADPAFLHYTFPALVE